jgi:phosphatidyl-myo-inositol dimannoside synthase
LKADVKLRMSAFAAAPLALAAGGWRVGQVARAIDASVVHAHWVTPSGVIAAAAKGTRPLVISLHGSDVFVAERHRLAGRAALAAFNRAAWVTACSDDLRQRAVKLGARPDRTTVVPYGVDSEQFKPDAGARAKGRALLGLADDVPVVFAFGRLVEKKGFEFLIDAAEILNLGHPSLVVAIAGEGDLDRPLRERAAAAGLTDCVRFLGRVPQSAIPTLLAAADVAVVPSIHDAAGNVDGLPNTVLEIMASGTPLVATKVGGIGAVAGDGLTALLAPEQDASALAVAIATLLADPRLRAQIGQRARDRVCRHYSWTRVAEAFEDIYERVAPAGGSRR